MSGICSASIDPNQSIHNYTSAETYPKMAIVISNLGITKQYPSIMKGINEKIQTQAKSRFSLVTDQIVSTHFMEYLEDNDIKDPNILKRKDIADFGSKYGYDYVAVLYFNQLGQRDSRGTFIFTWATNKTLSAEMAVKIVDTKDGSYIYRKDITKEGTSRSVFPIFTGSNTSVINSWLDIVDLCALEFINDIKDI
jgi:hypothetical protein